MLRISMISIKSQNFIEDSCHYLIAILITACTIQYPETAASAINMAIENWLLYLKLLINSCKMGKTISAHIFAVPPPVTNATESVLYVTDTSTYIDRF